MLGIALMAVFVAVQYSPVLRPFLPDPLVNLLSLGQLGDLKALKDAPGPWLARQSAVLLLGIAGMALLGASSQTGWPRAGLHLLRTGGRPLWTRILWAILLAYLAHQVVSRLGPGTLSAYGMGRGSSLRTLLQFLPWLPIVTGLYCSARLLFGATRRHADRWIGYVAAAASAVGFAWSLLPMVGLGDFLGAFGGLGGRLISFGHFVSVAIALVMDWVAIRAGLALARGPWQPAPVRGATSIALVLFGGYAGSRALLSPSHIVIYAKWLPAAYTAIEIALLAALAFCSLVGLADWLKSTAPAPDASAASAPAPFAARLRGFFGARFWADFGMAFVATCLLLGLSYGLLSTIPVMVWAFILPLVLLGFLAGPLLVFVFGVVKGRPGIVAVPVLMFVAVIGYRGVSVAAAQWRAEAAVKEAAALNVYPFAAPTRKHEIVTIEYSQESAPNGNCSPLCQRILMTSDYAVAVAEQPGGQWRLYRLEHGPLCTGADRIDSYLTFLGWGFTDTCIGMTRRPASATALVIQESEFKDSPLQALRPEGLRGAAFAFIERIDGEDRLLGRIFSGSTRPALMSGQKAIETPTKMTDLEFYAAALKLPLAQEPPRSDRDMAAVVAALEPYLTDGSLASEQRQKAESAFRGLGAAATSEAAEQPIHDALVRFWQSDNRHLAWLGFMALRELKHPAFAKPHIERLMHASDPKIMKDAVWSLSVFKGDLEFGKAPLAALLMDERAAAYEGDFRSVIDLLEMFEGPFPEEMRQQAKQQIITRTDLKDEDLLVVLAILWRGDEHTRQEAVNTIFTLDARRFAEAIIAINHKSETLQPGMSIKFWSEADMAHIVARLPEVPDDRLAEYVRFIQFQWTFKPHFDTVQDYLDERAATLAGGTPEEQKIARKIDEAAGKLHRR